MANIKPFGVPIDDLEKIRESVTEAWESWGDDDGPTCERIRKQGIWNDHIAMQAGIAVYKAFKVRELEEKIQLQEDALNDMAIALNEARGI